MSVQLPEIPLIGSKPPKFCPDCGALLPPAASGTPCRMVAILLLRCFDGTNGLPAAYYSRAEFLLTLYFIVFCYVSPSHIIWRIKKMKTILVKNLNNTAGRSPKGAASWLEWWQQHRPQSGKPHCSSCGAQDNIVGGHVKKVNSDDCRWFIVPLCKQCNKKTESFHVNEQDLVPVN